MIKFDDLWFLPVLLNSFSFFLMFDCRFCSSLSSFVFTPGCHASFFWFQWSFYHFSFTDFLEFCHFCATFVSMYALCVTDKLFLDLWVYSGCRKIEINCVSCPLLYLITTVRLDPHRIYKPYNPYLWSLLGFFRTIKNSNQIISFQIFFFTPFFFHNSKLHNPLLIKAYHLLYFF